VLKGAQAFEQDAEFATRELIRLYPVWKLAATKKGRHITGPLGQWAGNS
jgi:hypothetical protein